MESNPGPTVSYESVLAITKNVLKTLKFSTRKVLLGKIISLKCLLQYFRENTIIGLSETWLTGNGSSKVLNVLNDTHAQFRMDRFQKDEKKGGYGHICSKDTKHQKKDLI